MDVLKDLEERGFSPDKYENLLDEIVKKTQHESIFSWDDIVKQFDLDWTGDCVRKAAQVPLVGGAYVKEFFEQKMLASVDEPEGVSLLREKIRELEKEKTKLRDERSEWSKQNRTAARVEETLDLLEKKLKAIGEQRYENNYGIYLNFSASDNEMIVCLSDLHAGMQFDSPFGKYSSDILKKRLEIYQQTIIRAAKLHQINKLKIVGLGDMISGNIHKTIAISNRENVIEQVKLASTLIADFCAGFLDADFYVDFYNVSGNHSRITRKDEAVHDERLDDLVGWIVGNLLKHCEGFEYHDGIDTGIAIIESCGHKFVAVHGDYDLNTESSMYRLNTMLGFIPYGILCGHRHSSAYSDMNGVKIIQSGTIVGSGDDYTLEKRLSGRASQTALIVSKNGIRCIYDVDLEGN